ncbi:MAG: hypothetical protein A3H39_19455 [candidate division NC10 bacterium RIFCSPLOWO2_02_FULL_66_22]|nr:MAG: hypothetical protein A3H39_19455 [candidate division NC10 bacterium RIFCSPLOWO2_02_FULL_66_22]
MIGPHRLRQRLSQEARLFGPILNFNSSWFVDICGLIGFDFVFLDVGATGIQVPHIESAAEAEAAVAAIRYAPQGERGLAASTRAAGYGVDTPVPVYMDLANREVLFFAMIETARAVEQVGAIASTEVVDAIVLGPADLSQSLGFRGDTAAPAVQDAISRVITRAKANGKWVALNAMDVAGARRCLERGADIVLIGTAGWLMRTGRNFLTEAQQGLA